MFSKPSFVRPLLLVAITLPLLAACGPQIPDTIKIGVAQPLTGPSAARGQDILNGVKMAVDDINAGGLRIAGKPVKLELISVDDKGEPEQAKKVAQDLVNQGVYAVVGHLSSDVTEATIPVYKRGDVIQMFTSSAAELTKLGDGNAFRLVANDKLQAKAIASYASETLKASKVAIVNEDSAFGTPMKDDVSAELAKQNKKVELHEAVSNKVTDLTAFVAKLKAAQPDVLVAVLRDHQVLPLFQSMAAAGLSDMPVILTSVAKTAKMAGAPADVKRVYLTSSALDAREFATGAHFVAEFRGRYNAEPVWAAHYAYDAIHVLAHTLKAAATVDKNEVRAKLKTIDANAPVSVMMRFNRTGEQLYGAIGVYAKRDGRWEPLVRSDQW